ncbi:hypothetical protein ACA910_010303 [Epithemia clementina (nom. ined.)]
MGIAKNRTRPPDRRQYVRTQPVPPPIHPHHHWRSRGTVSPQFYQPPQHQEPARWKGEHVHRKERHRPKFFLDITAALPTPRYGWRRRQYEENHSVQLSELGSTSHNRDRRQKRGIEKLDLLKARRFGMMEKGRYGRLKYTYQGKVLIWDPKKNRAITCWNLGGRYDTNLPCGTQRMDPIMISKIPMYDQPAPKRDHNIVKQVVMQNQAHWNSHTVYVVDMSGSMRFDDVDGARCRSDAVWTTLARNLQHRLEKKTCSFWDVVSIVLMRETAQVYLECEPTDYVLYNKLVHLREWTTAQPRSHGYYKAALETTEELFNKNILGSCALSLFLCSDGRPSDWNASKLPEMMGNLASRFGRRLTVTCVGMAHHEGAPNEFKVLRDMVDEANEYGSRAFFEAPSKTSADSLARIVHGHVTSSLSSSVSELTDLRTNQRMVVRSDLVRERRSDHNNEEDNYPNPRSWRLFIGSNRTHHLGNITANVWKWSATQDDLCRLIDPRCLCCAVTTPHKEPCKQCNACFFCFDCLRSGRVAEAHSSEECFKMATERRQGSLVLDEFVSSFDVAWKKCTFSEGAERVAFKFRFMSLGDFCGHRLVAKESRFVENDSATLTQHKHHYHKQFLRAQFLASRYAEAYNDALNSWEKRCDDSFVREVVMRYPRIYFVKPFIFDLVENGEVKSVLVEQWLEGTYRKFNTNKGQLGTLAPRLKSGPWGTNIEQRFASMLLTPPSNFPCRNEELGTALGGRLEAVAEENEMDEEDDDDEEDEQLPMKDAGQANLGHYAAEHMSKVAGSSPIPDEDFINAFSHFSYVKSQGKLMVVDLQGVLHIREDGSRDFCLTDPAIHTKKKCDDERTPNFGRTNRGKRGIKAFFTTHKCNAACQLLGLRQHQTSF